MNDEIIEMDEKDFGNIPVDERSDQPSEEERPLDTVSENAVTNEPSEEQKLLDLLKSKVKYNGEPVDIKSLDDVVTNYQKGLNYDNLKAKTEKSDNEGLEFLRERAQKSGVTIAEYIKQVKAFEEEQIRQKNERAVEEMISNGVPEEVAREVIETKALRVALQREKQELEEQRQKAEQEKQKDKEFEDFLKAYPDIDTSAIPREVFENAKNSNLLSAYREYENKLLKERIKQLEQNQENVKSSPIIPTSNGSPVNIEPKDAFLEGFDL